MSKTLQDLNKMYSDGEGVDKSLFAEMRSNVLLVGGEHYHKRNWKMYQHIRDNSALTEDQKIRIMKNHTNRIFKTYVNRITSVAPGTHIVAHNEKELQDQKAAELHQAVWSHFKKKLNMKEKVRQFAEDYVGLGECWVRISWDWTRGDLKHEIGGEQEEVMDEQTGVPMMKTTPKEYIFSGEPRFDRIFAFNVVRPKACQSLDDAPWLAYRYMEQIETLVEQYPDLKDKIKPDGKRTFLVFDQNSADYAEAKDQVLVKEVYYRPCPEFPKGYFYKFIESEVLGEGELPEGIFPLVYTGFDSIPTHPRYMSPVKQWKPYQVEINRMASKMAEHQVTLGDDKLILLNGGKLSNGGNVPGIRALSTTGGSVSVVPGRTGEQYLNVLNNTVEELYNQAMVAEELESTMPAQVDPYAMLMQSAKWKIRFSANVERFERFLTQLTEVGLEIIRAYIEEDELIQVIGKNEQVNISEYKNAKPLGYLISLEPASEDIESRLGKKLALDRYIQYAGANMGKEDIGKFLRMDPYLNKEQIFSDFTLSYDNATNDILALDRGEIPAMNKYRYADPKYIIQKLSNRMGQSDFQFLNPQIQNNYAQVLQQYEMLVTQMAQEQAALNADMIPTDGALIRCDLWVAETQKDGSTKQVRLALPSSTLQWIQQRLEQQGATMQVLQQQQQAVVSDIAQQMQMQKAAQAQQAQPQMPAYAQKFMNMIQQAPGQG